MNLDRIKIFSIHFIQVCHVILVISTASKDQSLDQSNRPVQPRRASNQFSSKPLPIPTPPTVETPKTPKIRARMLQNVLTQIEHGQTVKSKSPNSFQSNSIHL